jgi:hypothetical protein
MRSNTGPTSRLFVSLFLATMGCSGAAPVRQPPAPGGTGGSEATGGSPATPTGGATATGGSTGGQVGGGDTGGSGGVPASPDAATTTSDGATTPPSAGDGGLPSYEGELPIYDGPPVGPEVTMDCPGDPTMGWTEYKDTFHVERPYDVPINTRFSLIGGIYDFWVNSNDKAHSTDANGKKPRTEARYGGLADAAGGGNFKTGMRMWSADMFLASSTKNSVVMQVHTTAKGIGPVYLVVNGTNVPPLSLPGGMLDKWFNLKVAFNAATLKSDLYVNNCLKNTITGIRGDGNFYFKHGVYHCDSGTCRARAKNIHVYQK